MAHPSATESTVLTPERAVLGAMMSGSLHAAKVCGQLVAGHFLDSKHRLIFTAAARVHTAGARPDLLTVTDDMRRAGTLDAVGGETFVSGVMDFVSSLSNVDFYCRAVKRNFLMRSVIQAADELKRRAQEPDSDPLESIAYGHTMLSTLLQDGQVPPDRTTAELIDEIVADIENRKSGGVDSGFASLDKLIGGFKKGDLIVLAARTSIGKTSFCANLCRRIAPRPSLFVSVEMTSRAIVERMLAAHTGLSCRKLRMEGATPDELDELRHEGTKSALDSVRVRLITKPDVSQVQLKVRNEWLYHGQSDLLVVDYAQLLSDRECAERKRHDEVASIVRKLKSLAVEMDVPLILAAQLNRGAEEHGRPTLVHLKESGALEEHSDVVMLLHAPYRHKKKDEMKPEQDRATVEVIVAKHRNGPVGIAKLHFNAELTRFEERDAGGFLR